MVYESINGEAEAAGQPSSFIFVPILRVHQLGTGRLSENNGEHLRATLFQFGLQRLPSHTAAAVLIDRCQAAFQFRLLGIA